MPPDWEKVPIGALGAVHAGGTPSRAYPSFWGGDIAWVTPGELTGLNAKMLMQTRERITRYGMISSAARLMPPGTILVTMRATIGAVAISSIPITTNQGFKSIVPNSATNPDFYYHLFGLVAPELVRLAAGSTFDEISRTNFIAITVPRPRQEEQQRIAEILDTIDAAIQSTEALIAKLRLMKAGLLHDLLTSSDWEQAILPVLNVSDDILVMVDEAHRSHTSALHANLLHALPNCTMIGFTGTPILLADRKRTHEIFGDFIDRYTIRQSQRDGATVPILYEGRTVNSGVADGRTLDAVFEEKFRENTVQEREKIVSRYATQDSVLEATELVAANAEDMLRHYVDIVLPNGLKAQVVAVSRLAAVRYQQAFVKAHKALVAAIESLEPSLLTLAEDKRTYLDEYTQFLLRAHRYLETLRKLEFAAIISGSFDDDPAWTEWTEKSRQETRIERFKRPLIGDDPAKADGLAFLIVKSMLLTGFDAPVEQSLYLDRFMQGHELLQAVARVNRTYHGKTCGLVVDYYGVMNHLQEALAVYSAEDILGALTSIKDELPKLADRHRRMIAIFRERGADGIADIEACVGLLRDKKVRADFTVKLKQFLESVDIVLPRSEALPFVPAAKRLGLINKMALNLYRDSELNLVAAGHKVRQLIDEHIVSQGIDPVAPPISIMDSNFTRTVEQHNSSRSKASEMEHAARYHIETHYNEDPAHFKKLSERLQEILNAFGENWDALVSALREFSEVVREGRSGDKTGLDPRTQAPFLGLILEERGVDIETSVPEMARMAAATVEMVDHIRQEIRAVDFWRTLHAQNLLRSWIVHYLDNNDLAPYDRQEALADRIVQLARTLHARLVT